MGGNITILPPSPHTPTEARAVLRAAALPGAGDHGGSKPRAGAQRELPKHRITKTEKQALGDDERLLSWHGQPDAVGWLASAKKPPKSLWCVQQRLAARGAPVVLSLAQASQRCPVLSSSTSTCPQRVPRSSWMNRVTDPAPAALGSGKTTRRAGEGRPSLPGVEVGFSSPSWLASRTRPRCNRAVCRQLGCGTAPALG